MDVGNWDLAAANNAPGQSESADSPHFSDLAKPWAEGEYFPLVFSESAVQANGKSVLTLNPR
jgi:penicillin amidase